MTITTATTMADRVQVIIARYREDVAWAQDIGYDYIVYDKGGDLPGNAVPLPNIGREGHTYMTHIVRHYESLADVTVFVQGDPFDHISEQGRGTVPMLRSMIEDVVDRRVPFMGLAWFRLKCDRLGHPHELAAVHNDGKWIGLSRDIPVGATFESLFNASCPDQVIARGASGCFCVRAERIRTRPKAFYEHAVRLFEADPDDLGNTGHAFERLWQFVFNGSLAWNKDHY
jgi:hypothetical protein